MVRRLTAGLLALLVGCAGPVVFESEAPIELDRWWRWTLTLSEGEVRTVVLPWEGEDLWDEAVVVLYGDCFDAQIGRPMHGRFNIEGDAACPLHAQLRFPQSICETRVEFPGGDPYVVLEDDALECREREASDRDRFVAPGFVPPVLRYD